MTVTESTAKPVPYDASIGRNLTKMGSAIALPVLGFIAIGVLWQIGSFVLGRYLPRRSTLHGQPSTTSFRAGTWSDWECRREVFFRT